MKLHFKGMPVIQDRRHEGQWGPLQSIITLKELVPNAVSYENWKKLLKTKPTPPPIPP